MTFERCWAFANGLSPDGKKLADGNGFKAGGYGSTPVERLPHPILRHIVRTCVAVDNRNSGFYANHHIVGCDWLSNSAYKNGANFNLLNRLPDNITDIPGLGHRLHNNLSYVSRGLIVQFEPEQNQASHNSFFMDITISDGDFESLDASELQWPRQPDGSLPVINFLRPTAKSVLINRGADVGLPYCGTHPDLGAFER